MQPTTLAILRGSLSDPAAWGSDDEPPSTVRSAGVVVALRPSPPETTEGLAAELVALERQRRALAAQEATARARLLARMASGGTRRVTVPGGSVSLVAPSTRALVAGVDGDATALRIVESRASLRVTVAS